MSAAARPSSVSGFVGPGRFADCYLGLLLPPGPAGEPEAGTVLVVAPAALLHPGIPRPVGRLVRELPTGQGPCARPRRMATPWYPPAGRPPGLRTAYRPSRAGAR